jgi:hypothetical protein
VIKVALARRGVFGQGSVGSHYIVKKRAKDAGDDVRISIRRLVLDEVRTVDKIAC